MEFESQNQVPASNYPLDDFDGVVNVRLKLAKIFEMDEPQDFGGILQDGVGFAENRFTETEIVIGQRKWLTLLRMVLMVRLCQH